MTSNPPNTPLPATKVALITGGAGGLGRAIAARLIERGVHCVLADVNPVALEQAVHALGPQASAQVVDLTSEAAREGLVRAVQQQWGRLDLLVKRYADDLTLLHPETQLTEQAQQLERHFSKTGAYSNAPDLSTGNEYYSITPTLSDSGFSLTATPKADGMMAGDKCGSFSIDQTGATSISGQADGLAAKDCWGR